MKIKHDAATPLYNLYPEKQLEIGKYFSEHPNEDRVVINPDDPESWLYYGSTDWMDEVYESSAPSYTVNFNISQKAKKDFLLLIRRICTPGWYATLWK